MAITNSSAAYLLPGMQLKVTAINRFIKHGLHKYEKADGTYDEATLANGFYIENTDVGSITAVAGEPTIIYTHNKFAPNKLVFIDANGNQGVIDVISVPIHDHSSIVTGGPAYGTYFADDETTETT